MKQKSESEEWLSELVESWTAVYKKSMTTVVLLRVIGEHGPVGVGVVAAEFAGATDWQITERGLYRTLRRLAASGLLETTEEAASRTGAMRKLFQLTSLGRNYLDEVESKILTLDKVDE